MKTIFFPDQTLNDGKYAATIGFFDGVHQGHQFLMRRLNEEARERGLLSMAITFERHPRQVVQGDWKPELLTDLHEKLRLLKATGIDVVVVLRFNRQMASLSAGEFMQLMHDRLGVRMLLTGYDNRFGHDRTEGFGDYQRYGRKIGIDVVCADALTVGQLNVSSSLVRRLLKAGNMEEANHCLGRPYSASGQVVHGEQIGRTIGFPTANLQPDDDKLVPMDGVYAVMVDLDNGMQLVLFVAPPQAESVVGATGHVPVVPAEEALVVIGKLLPAQLCEEALAKHYLCPGLVKRYLA